MSGLEIDQPAEVYVILQRRKPGLPGLRNRGKGVPSENETYLIAIQILFILHYSMYLFQAFAKVLLRHKHLFHVCEYICTINLQLEYFRTPFAS